jgi:hypothetical protein
VQLFSLPRGELVHFGNVTGVRPDLSRSTDAGLSR